MSSLGLESKENNLLV